MDGSDADAADYADAVCSSSQRGGNCKGPTLEYTIIIMYLDLFLQEWTRLDIRHDFQF